MALTAAALWFRAADGRLIRFEAHDAVPVDLLGSARGAIVTLHGLGEHLGKYEEWAEHAAGRGFHVMLYDQRGHGRTPGRRGDYRFDDLVLDLARFVEITADRYRDLPIFLVGHSLGAIVALHYASGELHPAVRGAVLSGPPISLSARRREWQRWVVLGLVRVAPWWPLRRRTAVHTRDAQRAALIAKDALGHKWITPRAMVETVKAIEDIRLMPGSVRLPLLVLLGEADSIVQVTETAEFFATVGTGDVTVARDVTVERFPDTLHEVFQEIERRALFDRVCDWFEERAGLRA